MINTRYDVFKEDFKIGKINFKVKEDSLNHDIIIIIETNIVGKKEATEICLDKFFKRILKLTRKIYTRNQYDILEINFNDKELIFSDGLKLCLNCNIYIYEMIMFVLPKIASDRKIGRPFDFKILNLESRDIAFFSFIKYSSTKYQSVLPVINHMIYDEKGFLLTYEDKIRKVKIIRSKI